MWQIQINLLVSTESTEFEEFLAQLRYNRLKLVWISEF